MNELYEILENLGGGTPDDNLKTTLYEEIIKATGGNIDDLPDGLETTYLKRIAECCGGDTSQLPDNLLTTICETIIRANGGSVEDLPDRLVSTCLKQIAENLVGGVNPNYELSGVWYFNDTISSPVAQDIEFAVNKRYCNAFSGSSGQLVYKAIDANHKGSYTAYSGGWNNKNDRIVSISYPQTVTKEFYDWFIANAKPAQSTTWVFNDVLALPSERIYLELNFTTSGESSTWHCYTLDISNTSSKTWVTYKDAYRGKQTDASTSLYPRGIDVYNPNNGGWIDAEFKTITINEEITNADLLAYLQANATKL